MPLICVLFQNKTDAEKVLQKDSGFKASSFLNRKDDNLSIQNSRERNSKETNLTNVS